MRRSRDTFDEFRIRTLKSVLFVLLCLPAAFAVFDLFSGRLVEPVEELTHRTGEWALRILILTLCITPLKTLSGWGKLVRLRRMLGLFSFFYMCLHFLVYLVLDNQFFWPELVADFTERPYIIAGMASLLLCLPLAVTSTNGMIKRLGGKAWKRLHKLVYPASIAAVLHFIWLVKADLTEPMIYAAILFLLLSYRIRTGAIPGRFRPRSPGASAALS